MLTTRNRLFTGPGWAAVLVFCIGSLHADLTLVQSLKSEAGEPIVETITMQSKGDRSRVDVGDTISTIADNSKQSVITLVHAQKTAMELPGKLLSTALQRAQSSKESTPIDYHPTGRKETISGFPCEEYTFTVEGETITTWFAKDVEDKETIIASMRALQNSGESITSPLVDLDTMPGLPIRTAVRLPDGGLSILTVESISTDELPDERFEVPKGYQSMKMPQIPTGR